MTKERAAGQTTSSPALSLDRLKIEHNSCITIISPRDNVKFLHEICRGRPMCLPSNFSVFVGNSGQTRRSAPTTISTKE
ncbi:PH domain-containing protein [Anaerobacterium chartisolvens]|uniref:PH domain-containing protein n=1 Tax=Anaerobacterium chartisolvens TaxID=1297424 RepID=UPI000DF1D648